MNNNVSLVRFSMRNLIFVPVLIALLLAGCAGNQQYGNQPVQPSAYQPPASPPAVNPAPPAMDNTSAPSGNPPANASMNQTAPPPSNTTPPQMNTTPPQMNQTPPANQTPQMNNTAPTSFDLDANDAGFYVNGSSVSSLDVPSGAQITITFHVMTSGVYHSGLDFRGCGTSTSGTPPGQSSSFVFSASAPCGITAYWPSTGVAKRTLQINPR